MDVEKKVLATVRDFGLISDGDKVVVALSGGKDSTSVLYILKKAGFDVCGLMIDLDLGEWSKIHRRNMEKFCGELGVPLSVVDLKKELGQGICFIKAVLKKQKGLTGCSVCGVVKKWILNRWARELGADKIATGHNLDDEAQNVLMNFLKGNVSLGARSAPKTGGGLQAAGSGGFVQRIKPLFFVPEAEVRKFAKEKKFDILYDRCPCAFGTYRVETRAWTEALSDVEKLKIVEGFQRLVRSWKLEVGSELGVCERCGEPTGNKICGFCEIVSNI